MRLANYLKSGMTAVLGGACLAKAQQKRAQAAPQPFEAGRDKPAPSMADALTHPRGPVAGGSAEPPRQQWGRPDWTALRESIVRMEDKIRGVDANPFGIMLGQASEGCVYGGYKIAGPVMFEMVLLEDDGYEKYVKTELKSLWEKRDLVLIGTNHNPSEVELRRRLTLDAPKDNFLLFVEGIAPHKDEAKRAEDLCERLQVPQSLAPQLGEAGPVFGLEREPLFFVSSAVYKLFRLHNQEPSPSLTAEVLSWLMVREAAKPVREEILKLDPNFIKTVSADTYGIETRSLLGTAMFNISDTFPPYLRDLTRGACYALEYHKPGRELPASIMQLTIAERNEDWANQVAETMARPSNYGKKAAIMCGMAHVEDLQARLAARGLLDD